MTAVPAMLAIDELRVNFGGVAALDGISLALAPGELLAIVGPNGAGKSTLVQVVSGFVRPDSGSVRFAGQEIAGAAPETIAGLGLARTFQTSRVFPELSVWESVMVGVHLESIGGGRFGRAVDPFSELFGALTGRRNARVRELAARVEEVLALFGDRLLAKRDAPARSLSYANRRRLEIARVLSAHPRAMLLDEPTAGMNPTESLELAEVIAGLHAARPQVGIVLIEHKLDVVRRLATRVIAMNFGKLVVTGTAAEVLADQRVIEAYLGRRTARGASA